jgi:hypothetical protein
MELSDKIIISTDHHTKETLEKLDSTLKKVRPVWLQELPTRDDLEAQLKNGIKKSSANVEELKQELASRIAKIPDAAGAVASDACGKAVAALLNAASAASKASFTELADNLSAKMGALEAKIASIAEAAGETRLALGELVARPQLAQLENALLSGFNNSSANTETLARELGDRIERIPGAAGAVASDVCGKSVAALLDVASAASKASFSELTESLSARMDAMEAKIAASAEEAGEARKALGELAARTQLDQLANQLLDGFSNSSANAETLARELGNRIEKIPDAAGAVASDACGKSVAALLDVASDASKASFFELRESLSARMDAMEAKIASSAEAAGESRKALDELAARPQLDQDAVSRIVLDVVGKASSWAVSKVAASVSASEAKTAALIEGLADKVTGLEFKLMEAETALAQSDAQTLAQATRAALPWYKKIFR